MKSVYTLLLTATLLGACSTPSTPTSQRHAGKGASAMTATPPAYTPPLAEGYRPGVPTVLEQIAPQSPYDADEAIRRALQLAVQVRSTNDLTPKRIEDTMSLPMPFPRDRVQGNRSGVYWLSKNWLLQFEYLIWRGDQFNAPRPYFKLEFIYDKAHWARMPDRTELCANRQMDVAAAEKILLDNGFYMTLDPDTRFNNRWAYYKEDVASVRIYSFGDGPLGNKHVCIRQIRLSV